MANSTLLKIDMVKLFKNLHNILIVKKQIFQIKIFNEINFFLIIICILTQLKVFIYSPQKYNGPLTFRMHCYWSIDHQNALQLTTVQLN